jgi:hypothetical protein
MADPISSRQLLLLRLVAKHPDVARDHLVKAGAADGDVVYLERQGLVQEREVGHYRISHLGTQVLKRSL